ncbi:MAG: hypothetical protein ACOX3A_08905 [bacterium]
MKKNITLALVFALVALTLIGCSASPSDSAGAGPDGTPAATDGAVQLGLGLITSIGKSRDYKVDADGKETLALGQVDTVIAAATFDAEGRVVAVTIDTAQTKVEFDNEMKVATDKTGQFKTKVELGNEYGMKRVSSIEKEWFEQIAALEKWMVGKTVAEIKGQKVKETNPDHPGVPDDPELTSLVTISVQDYIAAVEKAYNNAVAIENADTLGLGHIISIAKSKDYGVDANGIETLPTAQVDTVIAATTFDADGKVTGTIIDTAQTKVNFDQEGKITSDKTALIKSKLELGDEYGIGRVSSIGKNWYEQIDELGKWMVGKTVAEIKGLPVKEVNPDHPAVPDTPELTSLVTITVQDYIAAVEETAQSKPHLIISTYFNSPAEN